MPCPCGGGGSSAAGGRYENVKGDGTVAAFSSKAEAVASAGVHGGYVRPAGQAKA